MTVETPSAVSHCHHYQTKEVALSADALSLSQHGRVRTRARTVKVFSCKNPKYGLQAHDGILLGMSIFTWSKGVDDAHVLGDEIYM